METFSALPALCAGNSPVPVNSPHKGQWRGALMVSLICAWINDWVNNREAGDLRRHRGHYDGIVVGIQIKTQQFYSGKWVLKYRLQNDVHLASASMPYFHPIDKYTYFISIIRYQYSIARNVRQIDVPLVLTSNPFVLQVNTHFYTKYMYFVFSFPIDVVSTLSYKDAIVVDMYFSWPILVLMFKKKGGGGVSLTTKDIDYQTQLDSWAPLPHWGRVTHICVNKLTTIGSDNG